MRPPKGGMSGFSLPSMLTVSGVVAGLELAGEPRLERGVAVLVGGDLVAVERDDGVGHGAVEDERRLPCRPRPDRRRSVFW